MTGSSYRRFAKTCTRAARVVIRDRVRVTIILTLSLLVGSQIAVALVLEWGPDSLRDPEFYQKVPRYRARAAERPDAPMILVLGSSRVYLGLRPSGITERAPPAEPLLFNGGMVGAGPLMQRLMMDRWLRAGVRPAAVVCEFFPPHLLAHEDYLEEGRIDANRLSRAEAGLIGPFTLDPERFARSVRQARWSPLHAHRFIFRNLLVPGWHGNTQRIDHNWTSVDGWGWKPGPGNHDESERLERVNNARAEFTHALARPELDPRMVRAAEDTFAVCAEHGIPTALLWMPEASEFRAWYPPATAAVADALLARWRKQWGLSVVNARTWLADANTADGYHLTPDGATAFTEQFAREAVADWRQWRVPSPPTISPVSRPSGRLLE
ncbi:MAG TPA: hypothetical protein VL371_09980 [Gemmataceae bacterium]|nr:hypothetical protein [Gemmataceae bacterium]